MKTTFYIILLALVFIYLAHPVISLYPFRIQMDRWPQAVGTILILLGMLCFLEQGRRDGVKQSIEFIHDELKSNQKQ